MSILPLFGRKSPVLDTAEYPYMVSLTECKRFGEPPEDSLRAPGIQHPAKEVAQKLLAQCLTSFTVVYARWADDGDTRCLYFVYKRPGFYPARGDAVLEAGFAIYDGPV